MRRYLYHTWLVSLCVAIGGISFVCLGCGKKGPPRPPKRPLPPAVEDLRYAIQGDIVELSWTHPSIKGDNASKPASIKVFRAVLSGEDIKCENCPLRFEAVAEIPIHSKAPRKEGPRTLRYSEKIDPGYRYIYKVIVFDEYGIGSKNSNIVQFDH
jgi:hypothetical protein